jgi:hypothetical protein
MGAVIISATRTVIAVCLAGALVVQGVILPLLWVDLDGVATAPRVAVVSLAAAGVLALQIFGVCVWRLLGLVRRDAVFTPRAFRDVDVIIGSVVAVAAVVLAFGLLLVPGEAAPGVVALVCGAALVLAGLALLVVVMRTLLARAIARETEALALRAELGEVI